MVDLRRGVLRTPVDPLVSFSDDPLRMLRAARFVAGYGFTPDEPLVAAITQLRERLAIISAERIRDEFVKLLLLDRPGAGLSLLASTGLLGMFAPELSASLSGDGAVALVERSLRVVPADDASRLAVMFAAAHISAGVAATRLRALRCSVEVVDEVQDLLRMRANFLAPVSDEDVRRFLLATGARREQLFTLLRAVGPSAEVIDAVSLQVNALVGTEGEVVASELDGEAVMAALSIGPGRVVGEAMAMLREERVRFGPLGVSGAHERLTTWWVQRSVG